jgi:hypothetical protein
MRLWSSDGGDDGALVTQPIKIPPLIFTQQDFVDLIIIVEIHHKDLDHERST